MATVNEAGAKGGSSKSDKKRLAARTNAAKAREAKLQYRLDPLLRKTKTKIHAQLDKEIINNGY